MGLIPSFPFQYEPVCFVKESYLTLNGSWKKKFLKFKEDTILSEKEVIGKAYNPPKPWEENAQDLYKKIIYERQSIHKARLKFHEYDTEKIIKKWPKISADTFLDLRSFFLSFDVNGDYLIDFKEFCLVLDELGDQTPLYTRKSFFHEKDLDKSGALDFEEFLELFSNITSLPISSFTEPKLKVEKNCEIRSLDSVSDAHSSSELSDVPKELNISRIDEVSGINFEHLCEKARNAARILRQLSVNQQIIHGLF